MVLPIGAIGIAGAGALLQYLNSEEGRSLQQDEIKKIRSTINALQSPNFDTQRLTPEQYEVLGTYTPDVASYVAEKAPQMVTGSSTPEAKLGRSVQMDALQNLIAQSRGGADAMSRLGEAQRQSQLRGALGSQLLQAQEQAARRGTGFGSGSTLGALLAGNSQAADRAGMQGLQQESELQGRRMAAQSGAAQLGAQLYGQDLGVESQNVGAINAYNQRVADSQNAYNQYASHLGNQAQMTNLGARQQTAHQNVASRNQAAQYNQANINNLAQKNFSNQAQKIGMQNQVGQMQYDQIGQKTQDRNNLIGGLTGAAGKIYDYSQRDKDAYGGY